MLGFHPLISRCRTIVSVFGYLEDGLLATKSNNLAGKMCPYRLCSAIIEFVEYFAD